MVKFETYTQEAIDEETDLEPHGLASIDPDVVAEQRRRLNGLPSDFAEVVPLRAPRNDDAAIFRRVKAALEDDARAPPPTPAPEPEPRLEQYIPAATRVVHPPRLEGATAANFVRAPYAIMVDAPTCGITNAVTADMGRRGFVMLTGAILGSIIFAASR